MGVLRDIKRDGIDKVAPACIQGYNHCYYYFGKSGFEVECKKGSKNFENK